jgi:hypothetical protein
MLQKFCSSLVRASVFIKKLTLHRVNVRLELGRRDNNEHLRARPSRIYIRKKTISFPQWITWTLERVGSRSQWDESSRDDTRPFFETFFMTCCRRLTKYSSSCPVAACYCTTVQKEIYFPSCKDCTVHSSKMFSQKCPFLPPTSKLAQRLRTTTMLPSLSLPKQQSHEGVFPFHVTTTSWFQILSTFLCFQKEIKLV